MKIYAVVTGDIRNFTKLEDKKRGKLVLETELLLRRMVSREKDAQVFRGDSYQFLIADISQVLKKCVQLTCWFKINSDKEKHVSIGTKLSIGIGEIAYQGKSVLDSDGEAFHLSGRNFDEMDQDEVIRLTTFEEDRTMTYQIILMYINMIIRQWTISQAETIYELLNMEFVTQKGIAEKLKMSQPAIAKSLQAARWKEVEKGIDYINRQLEKQYFQ